MSPLRSRIEFAALLGVAALFRWLPIWAARILTAGVGFLASRVIQLRRQVALDNLHRAFPDLDEPHGERIYRSLWRHFASVGSELARLPRMTNAAFEKAVDGDEMEVLRRALRKGKGAIFVSGHLGNWEWLGGMCSRVGIPFTYVVATQSNKHVERWLDEMRASAGAEILSRKDSVKGTLTALRNNRVVAMLCDQDAGDSGVFVPFFDTLASTPRGPAVFHLKTGAALVFGDCCRQPDGRYKLHFEELPPHEPTSDREADETTVMAAITRRLEEEVRRYPDQYLWLHRRWKSRPPNR